MDAINHHLTDDLLMAYATGDLPEAFNLIVATHISMCDECRARLESFEAVGGALVEDTHAAPLAAGALESVLARLTEEEMSKPIEIERQVVESIFPQPLREYAGTDPDKVKWRGLGGGVRQSVLPTSGKAKARLLYIPAGMKMPEHGHHGLEATLVLQGAFSDDEGRYARGDIEVADEDLDHTPVAEMGEDCICLAVTDARLKFSGLIPRMAQPFLGI